MHDIILFLIEISISLAVSGFVIVSLSLPMQKLLEDICGTETRARFWVAYTKVMLVLAPLLTVFFLGSYGTLTDTHNFAFIKITLGFVLSALFISLLFIGAKIMGTIPKATQLQPDTAVEPDRPNGG